MVKRKKLKGRYLCNVLIESTSFYNNTKSRFPGLAVCLIKQNINFQ